MWLAETRSRLCPWSNKVIHCLIRWVARRRSLDAGVSSIFVEAADRKGLPVAIVEKDFWVCWVLKQLFSIETISGSLLFNGETTLPEIFRAINRFQKTSVWL